MISKVKLGIYKKYDRDENEIFLYGNDYEKKNFEKNNDWNEIANLIQNIILITDNLASEDFKQKTLREIEIKIEKEAVDLLYELAIKKKKAEKCKWLNKIKAVFKNRKRHRKYR